MVSFKKFPTHSLTMVKFQKQMLLVGLGCLLLLMLGQPLGTNQGTFKPTTEQPSTMGYYPIPDTWIQHWGAGLPEYYTKGLYFNGSDVFVLGWDNNVGTIHLL